mmetsp:Transcript_2204/g.5634  ORF Transcript_2204/g.5634 Transcript_2204/m.5634 type:complete len:384 (-) Transcript_2204:1633-2784(-)
MLVSEAAGCRTQLVGQVAWIHLISGAKDGQIVKRLSRLLTVLATRIHGRCQRIVDVSDCLLRCSLFNEHASELQIVRGANLNALLDDLLVLLRERIATTSIARQELAQVSGDAGFERFAACHERKAAGHVCHHELSGTAHAGFVAFHGKVLGHDLLRRDLGDADTTFHHRRNDVPNGSVNGNRDGSFEGLVREAGEFGLAGAGGLLNELGKVRIDRDVSRQVRDDGVGLQCVVAVAGCGTAVAAGAAVAPVQGRRGMLAARSAAGLRGRSNVEIGVAFLDGRNALAQHHVLQGDVFQSDVQVLAQNFNFKFDVHLQPVDVVDGPEHPQQAHQPGVRRPEDHRLLRTFQRLREERRDRDQLPGFVPLKQQFLAVEHDLQDGAVA